MEKVQTRKCNTCGLEKPVTELVPSQKYFGGFMPLCKPCRNAYWRNRRAEYPEVAKEHSAAVRRSRVLSSYGLTASDYDAMHAKQKGCCKLCGSPDTGRNDRFKFWNIDHCHKTSSVRGLLCHMCNITLGKFENLEALVGRDRILAYIDKEGGIECAPPLESSVIGEE